MTALQLQLATPVRLLVLIGGGEFSFGETREIDEFLLTNLPPENRIVAFLPAASGSAEYALHLGKYFSQIDSTVETMNVPIYRGRDSRRQKNVSLLIGAGMIYVGGGVTNNLLSTLRESAAEVAMREAAAKGSVIAAIGAGASSFGVYARDMRGGGTPLPGLGWIERTVIDAGFDPAQDTMLRRMMSMPEIDLGVGIPARTALAVRGDGSTQVIGSGRIAAFRKPT